MGYLVVGIGFRLFVNWVLSVGGVFLYRWFGWVLRLFGVLRGVRFVHVGCLSE